MLGLAAILGVVVGGVSFGFAGFAFALFATSALALARPPQVVIPTVMLLADTLALPLLWEHRAHLRRDLLRAVPPLAPWSLPLLLVGVGLGTFLLGRLTPAVGRLALAVVVLAFVGFQALRPPGHAATDAAVGGTGAGAGVALGAGLLDGWLGTGGVVIAVYLTWKRFAPAAFIAAMLVYFLGTDLLRAGSYAAFGYWTRATFDLYLSALPIALVGYVGGVALRRVLVPPAAFRAVVLLLLSVYALALIRAGLLPE